MAFLQPQTGSARYLSLKYIYMTTPKKSLGQHWLYDEPSLIAICAAAELDGHDHVLEVGPGTGTLTAKMVKKAARVTAVELDKELAKNLSGQIKSDNLSVYNQNILRFDLTKLPADYKVVANIPYYLTSNLVRVLSETSNPPFSVTILVQKEVAQRLAAEPGNMSLLSVTAQMYFVPTAGLVIKRDLFEPPPKVDSQIINLKRRDRPFYAESDPKELFQVVKAGFSNRRKTLLNSLSAGLRLSKDQTNEILLKSQIDPNLRPQDLSLQNWVDLYQNFKA